MISGKGGHVPIEIRVIAEKIMNTFLTSCMQNARDFLPSPIGPKQALAISISCYLWASFLCYPECKDALENQSTPLKGRWMLKSGAALWNHYRNKLIERDDDTRE